MFKIQTRLAVMYSFITVLFVLLGSVLFYSFFKLDVTSKPVMDSIYVTNGKVVGQNKTNSGKSDTAVIENKADIITSKVKTNAKYNSKYKKLIDKVSKTNKTIMISDGNSVVVVGPKGNLKVIANDDNNSSHYYNIKTGQSIKIKKVREKENIETATKSKPVVPENIKLVTAQQFETQFMNIIYKRFVFVFLIVIFSIIVINFLFSGVYVKFALKPILQLTNKVRAQSGMKKIELIELPKVNDEIYELTGAYNGALSKIKTSYEDLQRLNSYASHELRNSLAVLRGKIEIGEDTSELTSYIDKLTGVTNDILAMSTTDLSNSNEMIDLALICAKVADEYQRVYNGISLELPDEGVKLIKGKEIWVERCIVNLIDNAIKYNDDKKKVKEITIKVVENKNNITVSVYDNGVGIEESKLNQIFVPYYGSNSHVSTGIGLAYVKHVMTLHNGKVYVESRLGEYSKFSLIFNI